jgi:hypothetical protein
MFIIAAPASYADATPSPSPSPTSTPLKPLEQYKLDVELYKMQVSEREQVRKDITKEFMAKVRAANSFADAAMRKAKTDDAKSAILAQQKTAVSLAAAARDAAISNMGPAPIEPVRPSKLEIVKSSKSEPSKSPETIAAKKTKSPKATPTPSS